MNIDSVIFDVCSSGDRLMEAYHDIVQAEKYCAACRVYCRYLENNRKEAELIYSYFKEQNDKIFNTAMKMLDISIDISNTELAANSLYLIETMKSTYPQFYKAFYGKLFGK